MAGEGENLCLAGGLGYERAAGLRAGERSGCKNVFVQPVAGNAGTALGAVLHAWHGVYRREAARSLGDL